MSEEKKRNTPASMFAKKYVESANHPLTEEDIAHAYWEGLFEGRTAAWKKVSEISPSIKKNPGDQVAILFEVGRYRYDIKVVDVEEYESFVGSRNTPGIPLYWAYIRVAFFRRLRIPKPKVEKHNKIYGI